MRIIAGTAKGRRLASFGGKEIRPTPDRVREALFSILASRLQDLSGCRVLDLFAGTGALGLEALSRGADRAIFVERQPKAAAVLQENIRTCGFADRGRILRAEALRALPDLASRGPFELIFADPPYGKGLAGAALEGIVREGLLARRGLACLETASDESLPEKVRDLTLHLVRRYGSTHVHLYGFSDEEKESALS